MTVLLRLLASGTDSKTECIVDLKVKQSISHNAKDRVLA